VVEKTSRRGGARIKPGPQRNNTSGLLGIWFRWNHKHRRNLVHYWPEVCAAVGERRISRGLSRRTPREALREVIKQRADAGLPVDTLERAVRAFNRWAEATHHG
jgi:hypothetical protein